MPKKLLKDNVRSELKCWKKYIKIRPIEACQVDEEGYIETREGILKFYPGDYIALDSEGYPYPISKSEFERIYVLCPDSLESVCKNCCYWMYRGSVYDELQDKVYRIGNCMNPKSEFYLKSTKENDTCDLIFLRFCNRFDDGK